MKKFNDIKKICPVCMGLSFSLSKKQCDFCKANMWDMSKFLVSGDCKYGFVRPIKYVTIEFVELK